MWFTKFDWNSSLEYNPVTWHISMDSIQCTRVRLWSKTVTAASENGTASGVHVHVHVPVEHTNAQSLVDLVRPSMTPACLWMREIFDSSVIGFCRTWCTAAAAATINSVCFDLQCFASHQFQYSLMLNALPTPGCQSSLDTTPTDIFELPTIREECWTCLPPYTHMLHAHR